jgi:hypothetical protein
MDEGDIAKFTDAIKEFDSMTRLVCLVVIRMFYFETSKSLMGIFRVFVR